MGNVSEPATHHYLDRDIYTHITYANLEEEEQTDKDKIYKDPVQQTLAVGDTFTTSNSLVVVEALNKSVDKAALLLNENDIAVGVRLQVIDVNKQIRYAEPIFIIKGQSTYTKEAVIEELGLKFTFNRILPSINKLQIAVAEKKNNSREFVIMKAIIFPMINILWVGCILMILGTWLAIRKRILELRRK